MGPLVRRRDLQRAEAHGCALARHLVRLVAPRGPVALLAIVLAACNSPPAVSATPEPQLLDVPGSPVVDKTGEFYGVAWIDDDLVVGYEPDPEDVQGRPWIIPVAGGELRPLELRLDTACRIEQFFSPARSGDGQLVLARVCQPKITAESNPPHRERSIVVVDQADGSFRTIVRTAETADSIAVSDHLAGAFSAGSLICQGILGIVPPNVTQLQVVVEGRGRSFSLADDPQPGTNECDATGRADFPAVRPGTSDLTFLASPASVGVSGPERLDQPWGIYAVTAEGGSQLLLDGISDARGLAWSSDGEWLAFGGDIADRGKGLWAFHPETGAIGRVFDGPVDWLTWAPKGQEIAAITNDGDVTWPPARQLIRIDASALDK